MNFLVDAQLPRLLAIRLCELGHNSCHTLDLDSGNRTPDSTISAMADNTGAVVITKDADFLDSHIHIHRIAACFSQARLVELTQTSLIVHD